MIQPLEFEEACNELVTIQDIIRWSVSRFHEAEIYYGHGTDNAWDEAVNLVLTGLSLPLAINPSIQSARMTLTEKRYVLDIIRQRINERIPAAYLTHQAYFAEQQFYVDHRVLVPRSPIAELILAQFQPHLSVLPERILDLCTGSACIAISCSYQFPNAIIDAVDISIEALEVAEINIEQHDKTEQVFAIQSDLFTQLPTAQYDVIVSNPPYVDADDLAHMPEEYHHEPEIGLAAGDDGLVICKKILAQAANWLTDEGILIIEVGNSEYHLKEQFQGVPFYWFTFAQGGHGVFMLTRQQLQQYQSFFIE